MVIEGISFPKVIQAVANRVLSVDINVIAPKPTLQVGRKIWAGKVGSHVLILSVSFDDSGQHLPIV